MGLDVAWSSPSRGLAALIWTEGRQVRPPALSLWASTLEVAAVAGLLPACDFPGTCFHPGADGPRLCSLPRGRWPWNAVGEGQEAAMPGIQPWPLFSVCFVLTTDALCQQGAWAQWGAARETPGSWGQALGDLYLEMALRAIGFPVPHEGSAFLPCHSPDGSVG